MGAVNYGFFFFLLSKILSVNCLPNNPPNPIPFHGQNAPAPNSWTGQPVQSNLQGITNIFDAMNPNPSQNTYLNNNDNQQNIKYDQQYSTSQPYNSPHYYNQQYSMSQPYNKPLHNYQQQSYVPQSYNAPPYNYEQQPSVIQPYNAPQVSQKNQNQHFKEPQLYNLHPPSQNNGQKNSQSFGTNEPPIKKYQKQLLPSINQPIERLPDFGQPIKNANNQENIQQSSPPIPSIPNQSELSQMPSKLSQPIIKGSSTSNGYIVDNIEAEVPDFGQPINNAKNQETIQQSSPPIPSIPNQSELSQMPSKLSQPIIKGSSTSNGYIVDNKEAEVPDFGQPIKNANNQENIQQSSPPIPSIPNQSELSQIPSKLSQPIIKGSSTSNGYIVDNKEAEVPDFGQPISNSKNQYIIPQSSPPIPSIPNQSELSQMPSKLSQPIIKGSSTSNGYIVDNKEAEVPDFGQPIKIANNQENIQQSSPPIPSIPNQSELSQMPSKLSQPIIKGSSTSNGYIVDNKEAEVPDFGQPIKNANNQYIIPQSSPPIPSIPNQSELSQMPSKLSQPIIKGSSTSNGYIVDNKEAEVPDFGQPISNSKNQYIIPQSSPPIPSIPNQSELSQMPSKLSQPIIKGSSTSNGYIVDNIEAEVPDFGQPINNAKNQETIQQSSPPIPSIPNQSELSQMPSKLSQPIIKGSSTSNGYIVDNKEAEVPDFGQPIKNANNQETIQQSSPPIPSIPNQSELSQMPSKLSQPIIKGSSTSNGYIVDNKEAEVPDFGQPISNSKNQYIIPQSSPPIPSIPNQSELSQMPTKLSQPKIKSSSTSNGYIVDNKEAEVPDFGQPISNYKNQENIQQSSPPIPSIPNQSILSQISSQSSLKPFVKGSLTPPNENTMQITNDNMSLNSYLSLLDGQSKPLINDFVQNEDVLINNSQTDIQSFLNSENNGILNPSSNLLENQDDSQLIFNNVLPQLPMNVQAANVIIDPQSNNLISNMDLNDDTENLQNTLNEDSLPADFEDTELHEESKLENAMSESSIFALNDTDTKNDKLYSLENLTFDIPPPELDGLSNYDSSYIVDTENPKNAKEDNAKITVYANPNDVHILQLSPKQSSTNDNSYLINNNLLNTPSTGMPLWYFSLPNGDDYVQHFNSNTNKQLPNLLFNFNQNPAYNQIPMYLENSNYYNQQAVVDQNQMTSKTQLPDLSLDDNQPSSMDNSGYIYKQVDLKNPPPNSSNSWSLFKKDYTKNLRPNQNDRYTSGDGSTRTSFFGTPLSSYQNSNQGILNFPSNDLFVRNMISVISNSVQAPLEGTKAIFDVTNANFPSSSVSHIINLTHAIVRSVMLNLRQTLNTFMKTLYGHRVKRDFNPFEILHNLPGALVNKYSLQSTAAPTTKNINSPYYNQPTTADQTTAALYTGQQPTADYSNQPATKNMLGQQQMYGNEIDSNYYGSQNDNIGIVPQPASIQNYVLNSLIDAITSAVHSNVPAPYSIDSPEVKIFTQQVIVTAEIVFKNQIDNILHGQPPTLNMY